MLFSFTTIIISSLLFLIYVDWRNKRFNKTVNRIYTSFGSMIEKQIIAIESGEDLSEVEREYVTYKLKRNAYEKVFQNVIYRMSQDKVNRSIIVAYMGNFESYIRRKIRKTKSNRPIAYVQNVFMLGVYRLDHPFIIDYLLDGVNKPSISSRFNCMSSIAKIGNTNAMVSALMMSTESRKFLNKKVLIDLLENFEGNRLSVDRRLIYQFEQFDHELKLLTINYFYNQGSRKPLETFQAYIHQTDDKEEIIQLLKYFGNIRFEPALSDILVFLKHDAWEIRAIAAKSLILYCDVFAFEDVVDSMSDSNWYVRTNTAIAVYDHLKLVKNHSEQEIDHIISVLHDKYALGALEYAKHLKEDKAS